MSVEKFIDYEKLLTTNKGRVLLTSYDRDAKLGNVDDAVHDLDAVNLRQLRRLINSNTTIVRSLTPPLDTDVLWEDLNGATPLLKYFNSVTNVWESLIPIIPDTLFTTDLVVSLSGVKTAGKYTNGQTIPRIGKTVQEVMDDMYVETLFPILTNPFIGGVSFNVGTLLEIGTLVSTLTATSSFNRGSINPQYTSASPFRSGLPNTHVFIGPGGFSGSTTSTSLSPSKNITNYSILSGSNTFGIQVIYSAGVQPKDNTGNDYLSPLPAGSTAVSNGVITGAYLRFYGSSASTIPSTSAAIRVLTNTFNNTFSIVIPAGNTKVFFYYPNSMADITDSSVKYVEGFNANVGNIFSKTIININDAGGNSVSYKQYSVTLPAPESSNITYNVTIS